MAAYYGCAGFQREKQSDFWGRALPWDKKRISSKVLQALSCGVSVRGNLVSSMSCEVSVRENLVSSDWLFRPEIIAYFPVA